MIVRRVLLVVLAWPGIAGAAEVRYRAPGGCPDEPAFRAALQDAGAPSLDTSEAALDVRVTAEGPGFRGSATVRRGADVELAREHAAPRCEDVVAALALSIALVLEAPPPTAPAPRAKPRGEPTPARARGWATAGGLARAVSGRGSWAELGLEGSLDLPLSSAAPWLTLRAAYVEGLSASLGRADVRVSTRGGRVGACSLPRATAWLRVGPCVATTLGAIRFRSTAGDETRQWLALDLGARAAVQLGPVDLGGSLGGYAGLPPQRVLVTGTEVGRLDSVGAFAGLDAGVRFP